MKTVLVIDDDAVFRATLKRLLAGRGWEVSEAEDGESGSSQILQLRPKVVICDLRMPGSNGYQIIRFIQSHRDAVPKTRIIVTTASSYASDRLTALEAGADEYLIKPIIAAELFKFLDKFAAEEAEPAGAAPADAAASSKTKLKFWGVRGSLPTPGQGTVFYGGNTSCVELRADGEIIVLDAGTGIRSLGIQLANEFKNEVLQLTLLLTHTHWDHIQGFPFFAPAYNPRNIIRVLAYEGARRGLEATLSSQMETPYFPITMQQMPGNILIQELKSLSFKIGKVRVEAAFMNHPGVCVGYRLFTSQGSIAYLPDNELMQRLKTQGRASAETDSADVQAFARCQDQKLVEFLRGADILITDSQYDEQEYRTHVGWGHSCADDSVGLAVAANIKQFFLFHHDPNHDDLKVSQMVARAREVATELGNTTQVEGAREGLELELPPNVSVVG